MRGGRHYRRRGARRTVRARTPGTGPACGPSGQPVAKSRAKEDADADTVADTVADRRTATDCSARIDSRTDADALALSWLAEPFDVARSLSAPDA